MVKIIVTGGDFHDDPRSRFAGPAMVLYERQGRRERRYGPSKLTSFKLSEGAWERYFADAGEWTKGLAVAALAGAPAAGANFLLADFFTGQKALVTWANALIGAAAATAALKSSRHVRFKARFNDATMVEARAEERHLTARLPLIVNALIASGG